eukprot:TRINITY_DN12547_c1_g2_i1.p1 TRINITY_DN12547_c1_g2~~TRINITY_DN12547_c1_g2_i1.p1  ORF type:complete len:208 (+),score=34.05 TRINITY_DN12547_c1_g2_i1:85-624(+)
MTLLSPRTTDSLALSSDRASDVDTAMALSPAPRAPAEHRRSRDYMPNCPYGSTERDEGEEVGGAMCTSVPPAPPPTPSYALQGGESAVSPAADGGASDGSSPTVRPPPIYSPRAVPPGSAGESSLRSSPAEPSPGNTSTEATPPPNCRLPSLPPTGTNYTPCTARPRRNKGKGGCCVIC